MIDDSKLGRKDRSRPKASWPLGLSTLLVTACCVSGSFKLGDISYFMSGVIEISVHLDISGFFDSGENGDIGDWAHVDSFDETRIQADLSSAHFEAAYIDFDVDYDASKEQVSLLRTQTSTSPNTEMTFISWSGDEYTLDDDVCYLGWLENGEVNLAASYCGVDLGTMYCKAVQSDDPQPSCVTCDTGGLCSNCDTSKSLDDCLPPKSVGGSVDIDVDIDIDIDIDIDVDVAADEEPLWN